MVRIIGNFSDESFGLRGSVTTIEFQGPVEFRHNAEKASDTDPDMIAYTGAIPIGKAYKRTTINDPDRTYYRAILDDPSFTRPIEGNIVAKGNGKWDFMFSRKSAKSPVAANDNGANGARQDDPAARS